MVESGETLGATEMATEAEEVHVDPFPFDKLPIEIRAMVYKELLVMPSLIIVSPYCRAYAREESSPANTPEAQSLSYLKYRRWFAPDFAKITQNQIVPYFTIGRSVYREAVPIYFGLNTFDFWDLDTFEKFARTIGPDCRWQLSNISVDYSGTAPARAVKLLVGCVGLRKLKLSLSSCSTSSKGQRNGAAIKLFGQKDLVRVRGLTKLDLEFSQYMGHRNYVHCTQEEKDALVETLQVLKQPQDPKMLKRQGAKDFPQKSRRTIFGEANVMTRTEREMLGVKLSDL